MVAGRARGDLIHQGPAQRGGAALPLVRPDEGRDGLAEQVVQDVEPGEAVRCRIGEADQALIVHDRQADRDAVHQLAEAGLRGPQRLRRPQALGHLAGGRQHRLQRGVLQPVVDP